ncbi:MAG TPA: proline dehydrogenase family protein [Thermomicrobiales bacterium]|nr:proline dehydrogenase family protein [Thermomicrobiales bacterium]
MLRQLFLTLSHQDWAYRALLSNPVTRGMAWRFVAGEDVDAALAAVRALTAQGITATLDHLGENVGTEAEAVAAAGDIVAVLRRIAAARFDSHVSIKLTQLGLDIDADLCRAQVRRVLDCARDLGNFVRIDMEGSAYTQRTLDLFYELREDYGADTVGVVIQSYLYRSRADVERAIATGSRVRLVKGAYDEPADIAYPEKADVDRAYRVEMEMLLARGRYPAIATHDERLIGRAQGFAAAEKLDERGFEFQMLYGVRRDLQARLAAEGYHVRCYVPYGTQWYPYFMRRLAERPANVVFILGNLLRK